MLVKSVPNTYQLCNLNTRKPKGFGFSPYPIRSLLRVVANAIFNGKFSYLNPNRNQMTLASRKGQIYKTDEISKNPTTLKIIFLGDIMVSKSGKPPQLDESAQKLLKSADIIVANVESPVVNSSAPIKRKFSLNFRMPASYLSHIYSYNKDAKWVFSIANNHACDTSKKSKLDEDGVLETIKSIRSVMPDAEVIGAEVGNAKSVLTLKSHASKIGIVGWTEVMNHDKQHYKKRIIRETDLTDSKVKQIKNDHDILIGFAHGNEEQSYSPLQETRDRWVQLTGKEKFDVIIGHGPHVLQPAEKIGNHGLIFHSIGNFCSPVGKSQTKVGLIPEISISYEKDKISSIDYDIHLLQQNGENLSIIKNHSLHLSIFKRLQKNWKTFFN